MRMRSLSGCARPASSLSRRRSGAGCGGTGVRAARLPQPAPERRLGRALDLVGLNSATCALKDYCALEPMNNFLVDQYISLRGRSYDRC